MARVLSGLDVLAKENCKRLKGARVGLLANQAAVDVNFDHILDILHQSPNCKLARLFAPEHGFRGELQDMASVENAVEAKTELPIISLYGKTAESLAPTEAQLEGLDALIVDLPDIGTRYYTFAQSLAYTMRVAKRCGLKIIVIDRPNPISGSEIEGSPLHPDFTSFCGYAPVPQRHGLTLGELAQVMHSGIAAEGFPAIDVELEIVKMSGWKREMYFDQTGLPWIPPSPNMPTLETAIVYPGGCLFEATEISEGRGTTKPFEFIGAPKIDSELWIDAVPRQGIPLEGALLRATGFLPQFQKHGGKHCSGVQLHITSRATFKPLRWNIAMLFALKQSHPQLFEWRKAAYEFIEDKPAIDILYGDVTLRESIDNGADGTKVLAEMQDYETRFAGLRKEYLLY